jgi:hypothetical protein
MSIFECCNTGNSQQFYQLLETDVDLNGVTPSG